MERKEFKNIDSMLQEIEQERTLVYNTILEFNSNYLKHGLIMRILLYPWYAWKVHTIKKNSLNKIQKLTAYMNDCIDRQTTVYTEQLTKLEQTKSILHKLDELHKQNHISNNHINKNKLLAEKQNKDDKEYPIV